MSATVSRRENTIVAWHEVPGKAPSKAPSRRVRYDRAQLIPEEFLVELSPESSDRRARLHNQTVPYGTALLGLGCPRHFVPVYDRIVPPDISPFFFGPLPPLATWTFNTIITDISVF
jgi:hypothetical protein